jgi:cysteine-rich repeat protein
VLLAAADGGAADATVAACGRRLASVAAHEARARVRVSGRCLAEVVACPAGLDPTATASGDGCLRQAGARCRARRAALARLGARTGRVRAGCAARLGADVLLDDDGLAYARLEAFCRAEIPDAEVAFACQTATLACTADAIVGTLAPRTAEVLARAGVAVDGARCFDAARCGNGEVDDEEECDDGPANSDIRPDACRTTCLEAFCGDGLVDEFESCDDGNDRDGDGCDADCEAEDGTCGDGVVGDDEECDDGNRRDRDGCDADCLLEPGVCGDGVLDDDEECDEGAANSDVVPDRCRRDCTEPVCGDGVVDLDAGETCEPPGTLLCTADCERRLLGLSRAPAERPELHGCQRALLKSGVRLAARARSLVDRCVLAVGRCLLALDEASPLVERCLARAARLCEGTADRRDAALGRAVAEAVGRCAGVPLPDLLRPEATGLGFADIAATCAAGADPPVAADLIQCVVDRARCQGERTVAVSVPRAYELLGEVVDDPADRFACVVDPDEIGSPSGAFVDRP